MAPQHVAKAAAAVIEGVVVLGAEHALPGEQIFVAIPFPFIFSVQKIFSWPIIKA